MYKVLIIGGERFGNYDMFESKCKHYLAEKARTEGVMIYSTGDSFVDAFSEKWGIPVKRFYCDWKTYGKNALNERNERIFSDCDALIAFADGLTNTRKLCEIAETKGLPRRIAGQMWK